MLLVLNCGSQSIKYKVFDKKQLAVVDSGHFAHPENYEQKLREILEKVKKEHKIAVIGHRVVHGGDFFRETSVIKDKELELLEKISGLAPLHNPYNVLGIRMAEEVFGGVPNIAVFDTAFYKTLPRYAAEYALPKYISENYGFKRFGFHGISHQYAAEEAVARLGRPLAELKLITCHLGGGSSITAIYKGKAVDTSMGFTPLEGLVMTTRSGDIDPGLVLCLCNELGLEKTKKILNEDSGLKGLCGNADMLSILDMVEKDDAEAKKALEVYVYRIRKYIGAYFAVLNGCDALVFTGSIGAGRPETREAICGGLKILEKSEVLTIPADEELAIAREISKF